MKQTVKFARNRLNLYRAKCHYHFVGQSLIVRAGSTGK